MPVIFSRRALVRVAVPAFSILFASAVAGCGTPSSRELSRDGWIYPIDLPVATFSRMESEVTEIEPGLRVRPFPENARLAGRPRSDAGRALESGEILAELPPGRRVELPWRVPLLNEYLPSDRRVIGFANGVVDELDRELLAEQRLATWSP